MRVLGLVVVFCTCFPPGAGAQTDGRWLIVPTTAESDRSWVEPAASSVRAELAERGVDVWSLDEAAARFEAEGSAPPAQVTEGEIQEWVTRSNAAVEDLVEGSPSRALDQLNEAQEFSRSAVEALNREEGRSQRLFDTCLYGVRALLEIGSRSRAEAQATECRQLVPIGEPGARMHPPVVLKILEQIDAARTEQTGALVISSEPSGCTARERRAGR